jgi:predicted nucleotidyltransferase
MPLGAACTRRSGTQGDPLSELLGLTVAAPASWDAGCAPIGRASWHLERPRGNLRRVTAPDISATLTRLLAATPPRGLVSAYLFGSHADGRAHRESDVDLGVLLGWEVHRTRSERFDERVRLSAWLAAELRVPNVDVVVVNDAPPQLGRRIVTGGRRVFCADPEADHAFVRDVQLRAADLEPFLRRTRRVKLAAIAR